MDRYGDITTAIIRRKNEDTQQGYQQPCCTANWKARITNDMQRQNRIVRQNGYAPMRTNVQKHRETTVKKKYKAVWALKLTDMSKDYVTLLSLNLLLCLHLLNISERLLILVRKSAFKIANFSSKHRLQDLAPLE